MEGFRGKCDNVLAAIATLILSHTLYFVHCDINSGLNPIIYYVRSLYCLLSVVLVLFKKKLYFNSSLHASIYILSKFIYVCKSDSPNSNIQGQ